MKDVQLISLALGRGESRRVLVDAGTTVWVGSGRLVLRGPLVWLAEAVLAPEQSLNAEQTCRVAEGGWIELVTGDGAAIVLIPPHRLSLWQQLGDGLQRLLGRDAESSRATAPHMVAPSGPDCLPPG